MSGDMRPRCPGLGREPSTSCTVCRLKGAGERVPTTTVVDVDISIRENGGRPTLSNFTKQTRLANVQRQLFLPIVLPQSEVLLRDNRRHRSWVEREDGQPLLANPREKPSMLGRHDSFDCSRTVSCDSYPSRHSLPSILGLVLSRSNHPRSSGSRDTRSAVLAAKTSWRAHCARQPFTRRCKLRSCAPVG